jgi:hypothetical protein
MPYSFKEFSLVYILKSTAGRKCFIGSHISNKNCILSGELIFMNEAYPSANLGLATVARNWI